MPRQPDEILADAGESLATGLAAGITRRSFLGRLGAATLGLVGGAAVAAAVETEDAQAFHFCGHTYTTGSCPSPYYLPRIDKHGYPLRPKDGKRIDNLGRLINAQGFPINKNGNRLRGPDGRLLPKAPRTRLCADWVPERYGIDARIQGAWYRCCHDQIRKLVDCCSHSKKRVNGDASLRGYCYAPRRVFCVQYYDTGLPC
ncbi:MAG TPA: hypothetical protein VH306_02745 [Gaiellaceae bacterium]